MIQEAIRDQILSMTGNHVSVIDVVIDDIKQESLDRDDEEDHGLTKTLNKLSCLYNFKTTSVLTQRALLSPVFWYSLLSVLFLLILWGIIKKTRSELVSVLR